MKVKRRIVEAECGRKFELVPENTKYSCFGCDAIENRECAFGLDFRPCPSHMILKEIKS